MLLGALGAVVVEVKGWADATSAALTPLLLDNLNLDKVRKITMK